MKKSFIIALMMVLLPSLRAVCQDIVPVDADTKKITYKEVVQQEGTPQKLYIQAIAWINGFYENPTDATRIRDVENAKIEIRHRIKLTSTDKKGVTTDAGVVNYVMTLEFKENRYRYIITDFTLAAVSKFPLERWLDKKDPQYSPACDEYLRQVNQAVQDIIKSLKTGMVPKVVKPDEW